MVWFDWLKDKLSHIWHLYHKPLIIIFTGPFFYEILGGVTVHGGYRGIPPSMNKWQSFLFVLADIITIVCIVWISFIAYREKHKND
ncbi:hypothetical protein PT286_00200 [Neisseriaceae bacterium ESL0693]|nr:hypothetical protein [Neisseriaceae bacterium ESL0693]MDF7675168.1 hypothetical protein [Neisseriaceae bacterium ESL0693]